jgi:Flp pilus assembly pilin Flp
MISYLVHRLRLPLDTRAVTSLEYGLIAGVIVGVMMVGFRGFATTLAAKFTAIGASL